MRKLLTCTTALSLALSPISGMPARAQTLADDGSVLGPDGSILCTPSDGVACDVDAIRAQLTAEAEAAAAAQAAAEAEAAAAAQAAAEAEAAAQAEATAAAQAAAEAEAAAQAEAEAAARAAAEAAAAEAAAQAEAEAQAAAAAQAAADAAAQAEADAAAQAAAEAAAQAEAEAQAAAEASAAADAEAAAQADAEAAARAAEEAAAAAAAQAEAESKAAAEALAEAEAAAQAVEDPAAAPVAEQPAADPVIEPAPAAEEPAVEPVVEEPVVEPTPEVAVEPTPEATPEAAVEPTPEPVVEPAPDAVTEAPAEAPAEAAVVEPSLEPVPEPLPTPAAEAVSEPVDIPEVSTEASDSLADILAIPPAADAGTDNEGLAASAAAAAAAAVIDPETLLPITPTEGSTAATDGTAPAPTEPVSVATEVISDLTTRASSEEFAAAPVAASSGKKSGLSDLEKVGLLALGALVVGAIINEGKKDQREVVEATGDRVVVLNPDGTYDVYKDDDAVLRRPGVTTRTESYRDGSTRTIVQRPDGTQVVTVRDASGRVLRRSVYDRSGIETVLIDDLYVEEPIIISELPRPKPGRVTISTSDNDAALKAELAALEAEDIGRKFSLRQIRDIPEVRALAATIEVDSITFNSGSAVIDATEARKLADLGRLMGQLLEDNPGHVFLIEGHTDAVGSAASNLLLSDRRAESLALALTEYFEIPPENMVIQGYGESELKVASQGDERSNRRVLVRLITPLMRTAALR